METNKRVGDYEILDELGSGGMGRVYRVRNLISDRVEAMKVLLPDLVGRQDLAARFLREIKVLATLNHPHIATLRTALTVDNQLVMVMEFVEGQSLANRLTHGPIATADALKYIDQALDALGYAHQQHVIHRDIKPGNMMLTPQGVVKLTDFGIARSGNDPALTVTGTTTGSLSYMSPEQVNGGATDARSDLYSLGISLYEMVTGERPFEANSDFGVMLAHLKEQPKPPIELQPGMAPELNRIILKAIAKNPAERFQSADEFRQALKTLPVGVRSQSASNHPRTVLDTRTPSTPRTVLDTRTPSLSRPEAPPPGRRSVAAVQAPPPKPAHPLLYIALGGVLVVALLAGTGLYLRRASATTETSGTPTTSPAATPASAPAAAAPSPQPVPPIAPPQTALRPQGGPPVAASPASATSAMGSTPASTKVPASTAGRPASESAAPKAITSAEPAARKADPKEGTREPPQDSAELKEVQRDIDQLSARAEAVNGTLDRMRQQQAQQGLGLRGDIAARQSAMNLNLKRADEAIAKGEAGSARKYRDLAQSDAEVLEKFLGR